MNGRLRLRESKKLAHSHTAEPKLKYSDGRGGQLCPCSAPGGHTWTLQTPVGQVLHGHGPLCTLSKATWQVGPLGGGRPGRVTQQKGGSIELSWLSSPLPSTLPPALRGSGVPPVCAADPWPQR